jgi:proteic killer suppression protein
MGRGGDELDIAWIPCYHVSMILSFRDRGTEDVYNGLETRKARAACPAELWEVAFRKLDVLYQTEDLETLKVPPGNRLEALHGDRKGQHSIRINSQYRICFRWSSAGAEDVEIVDYH